MQSLPKKHTDILVSVWMIAYNHENYITQAIESVLMQETDFEFEIVIGEDCSTDNTREILLSYQKKHPNLFKLILHPTNVGMINNQNDTFSACNGRYIAMLEGDDYWLDKQKLQIQVNYMRKFPDCKLCFHPAIETKKGRTLSRHAKTDKIIPAKYFIAGGGYYCPTPALMLDRSVIQNLPPFLDRAPAGDYYLQILGAASGSGGIYIDRAMSAYRVDSEGSWSQSVKQFNNKQSFRIRTVDMLSEMDNFMRKDLTSFFKKKKFEVLLLIAFDYLINDNKQQFRVFYKLAKQNQQSITLNYLIISFLYQAPWLLKTIYSGVKISRKIYRELLKR